MWLWQNVKFKAFYKIGDFILPPLVKKYAIKNAIKDLIIHIEFEYKASYINWIKIQNMFFWVRNLFKFNFVCQR